MEMHNYRMLCTKEQTVRAVHLGAELDKVDPDCNILLLKDSYIELNHEKYFIPTIEEMIGWLYKEFGIIIGISAKNIPYVGFQTQNATKYSFKQMKECRMERTFESSIDYTLSYLENKKMNPRRCENCKFFEQSNNLYDIGYCDYEGCVGKDSYVCQCFVDKMITES